MRAASERQKRHYDLKAHKHLYQQGDAVWLHSPARKKGLSPKLQRPWEGPYLVLDRLSDVTYRIQKSQRSKPRVVHNNRLKKYEGEHPPSWRQEIPQESYEDPLDITLPTIFEDKAEGEEENHQDGITPMETDYPPDQGNDGDPEEVPGSDKLDKGEYEVEEVIRARKNGRGEIEYLLKWKNFPPKLNSWQNERDLNETLKQYIQQKEITLARRGRPPKK